MPIYEYRCEACGHTLDALQKVSDAHLTDCPACSESALKRLISAPSFRLKGSGWYETDFKSENERKRNLAETGDRESGDKKSEAGADKVDKADKADKVKESAKPEKKSESTSETKPTDKGKKSGSEAA